MPGKPLEIGLESDGDPRTQAHTNESLSRMCPQTYVVCGTCESLWGRQTGTFLEAEQLVAY